MWKVMTLVVPLVGWVLGTSDISILDQLSRLSVIAFLILAFYGFYKRWWVFGQTHTEMMNNCKEAISELERRNEKLAQQRDAWMRVALRSTGVVESLAEEMKKGSAE